MGFAVFLFLISLFSFGFCSNCSSGERIRCNSWWRWASKSDCEARGCCVSGLLPLDDCFFPQPAVPIKRIHVVQGCHFDAGFVAPCPDIINRWFHEFFPLALQVGKALEANYTGPGSPALHFTAQSWLIELFLRCPKQYAQVGVVCPNATEISQFKEAVARGYITWHAFPFNGEAETMDESLFSFALNMTHTLDDMFQLPHKTVLSQRDVPGMTKSVIPLLRKNGIQAISVGSNGGSAPASVPRAFIWKNGAQSVRAFWVGGGYSGFALPGEVTLTQIPGSEDALVVKWRGDNAGPPQVAEVLSDWSQLQKLYPGVQIVASTFDKFVEAVSTVDDSNFPVIDSEIGDTWIYGMASDPTKVRNMRILNQMRSQCLASGQCNMSDQRVWDFSVISLKNAEHTWGRDQKVSLGDYVHSAWTNQEFDALVNTPLFVNYSNSWNLQRYMGITAALSALQDHPLASQIQQAITQAANPVWPANSGFVRSSSPQVQCGPLTLNFDYTLGALTSVQRKGTTVLNGTFGQVVYVQYDGNDYQNFAKNYNYGYPYLVDKYDFLKVNLPGNVKHSETSPTISGIYYNSQSAAVVVTYNRLNADYAVRYDCSNTATDMDVTVVVHNKTSTRLPESTSVLFNPSQCSNWAAIKLGYSIDPSNVVTGASKRLHAVDQASCNSFIVTPIDAPLVAFGGNSAFPSPIDSQPDMTKGASFCLHNNLWNTNYIMWFPFTDSDRGAIQYRYEISF